MVRSIIRGQIRRVGRVYEVERKGIRKQKIKTHPKIPSLHLLPPLQISVRTSGIRTTSNPARSLIYSIIINPYSPVVFTVDSIVVADSLGEVGVFESGARDGEDIGRWTGRRYG